MLVVLGSTSREALEGTLPVVSATETSYDVALKANPVELEFRA